MTFLEKEVIINDKISFIENCDLVTFAFLNSSVFNCWNKAVSGRTRNDTLLSNTITYNNFPFLELKERDYNLISDAVQAILDVRLSYSQSTLADLYGSISMPPLLVKAHRVLDSLILDAYGLPKDSSDDQILQALFKLYSESQLETIL